MNILGKLSLKKLKFGRFQNLLILIVCVILSLYVARENFTNNKENFSNSNGNSNSNNNSNNNIIIKNADDKLKSIIKKSDNSIDNLIKLSHEWCANMRNSKSLSTACLPLADKNGKNKRFFPISVCCSTCYCQILKKNGKFHYKYDADKDIYYLVKSNKVVQVMRGFKKNNDCLKEAKNENLYFPNLKLSVIRNKICKK